MFAIEITSENLNEIEITTPWWDPMHSSFDLELFLDSPKKWYFVNGIIDAAVGKVTWTIIPEYVLVKCYDYDPVKIKTDWDQIVHKQ